MYTACLPPPSTFMAWLTRVRICDKRVARPPRDGEFSPIPRSYRGHKRESEIIYNLMGNTVSNDEISAYIFCFVNKKKDVLSFLVHPV